MNEQVPVHIDARLAKRAEGRARVRGKDLAEYVEQALHELMVDDYLPSELEAVYAATAIRYRRGEAALADDVDPAAESTRDNSELLGTKWKGQFKPAERGDHDARYRYLANKYLR